MEEAVARARPRDRGMCMGMGKVGVVLENAEAEGTAAECGETPLEAVLMAMVYPRLPSNSFLCWLSYFAFRASSPHAAEV